MSYYEKLFNYMSSEHGVNLIESEMHEIEMIVLTMNDIPLKAVLETSLIYKDVIDYLNEVSGSSFRYANAHKRIIEARFKEKFTLDDFKAVIDTKSAQWKGGTMHKFLRPATLFQASKMDGYLQESKTIIVKTNEEKTTAERASDTVEKFFG